MDLRELLAVSVEAAILGGKEVKSIYGQNAQQVKNFSQKSESSSLLLILYYKLAKLIPVDR